MILGLDEGANNFRIRRLATPWITEVTAGSDAEGWFTPWGFQASERPVLLCHAGSDPDRRR